MREAADASAQAVAVALSKDDEDFWKLDESVDDNKPNEVVGKPVESGLLTATAANATVVVDSPQKTLIVRIVEAETWL